MRYRDFRPSRRALNEGKQVGVLYHFTGLHEAWQIIASDRMVPKKGGGITAMGGFFVIDRFREWVSLTRNPDLKATAEGRRRR